MSRWPTRLRFSAPALQPGGTTEALYSADLPNREDAHTECIVPVGAPATVRWDDPLPLAGAWVRFRPGWAPAAWDLGVCGADGLWRWQAGPPGEAVRVALGGRLARGLGLRAAQGPPGKRPLLRVRALAPQVAGAPPPRVELERDGARHTPRLPLASDANPQTAVAVSDADAVWITPPAPARAVCLSVAQVGGCGAAAEVVRWLAAAQVSPPATVTVDASEGGLVGGVVRAHLSFPRPVDRLRLSGPPRPRPLGLRGVAFDQPPAGAPVTAAPIPPLPADAAAPHPVHFAATLKVPGVRAALAVGADGRLALPWGGGHAATLHVAVGDGAGVLARREATGQQALLGDAATVWVDEVAAHLALRGAGLQVGLAVAEGLQPRPQRWRLQADQLLAGDRPVARLAGDWRLTVGGEARLALVSEVGALRLPLPELGGAAAAPATPAAVSLPGAWQGWLQGALDRAARFDTTGALTYGVWPSVYHSDVFGLEEDYLAQAVAQWGDPARGLAWLRATYLTAEHLDPRHYLYDLRAGLTPWQIARALRRAGLGWGALDAREQRLLAACGAWTVAQRALTADADGTADAHGVRVFPGCLPPARYGGDLGFATQPLYLSLVHVAGLRALGELTGAARWQAEAQALRAAARAALAAVATPTTQPLHSGGSDPGQYLQLMACGILMPVDVLPDDDPVYQRLEGQLVAEGRLFRELPRFDGWGEAPGIDGVYALGWLLRALRLGDRARFHRGLRALLQWAGDPSVLTWREVGPIRTAPRPPDPLLPGRRLSQSEPCLGGLGGFLQCLRHALVTPLADADGRLTGRLRIGAGLLPEWEGQPLRAEGLATLGGPVDLRITAGECWVRAPACDGLEVCDWSGAVVATLPAGEHRVRL